MTQSDFNSHVHVFRGELNSRQLFRSDQTSEFGFNIVRTGYFYLVLQGGGSMHPTTVGMLLHFLAP